MSTITTKDGVEIFYKDWGQGQPIVFSHGWPLSADDWDAQMMFFLAQGLPRRSPTTGAATAARRRSSDGHDMDHYADDLAALTAHLDLKDAVHVGHSTGGGEVVRYLARHGESRVAKAAHHQRGAAADGEDARPIRAACRRTVFDGFQAQARHQPGAVLPRPCRRARSTASTGRARRSSQGIILNWWRQGMMGGAKAHYDGIVAFSQTDFTEDLKKITVPVLVMHGDDDQIVPYADSGAAVGQAAEERHAEDLQGLPARHADDARRRRSTPTCWRSSGHDSLAGRLSGEGGSTSPTRG